ncbi:MAG: hypothetical protein HYX78_06680 [Armatimonadetes bacterium]|nr:hypothetical protein [Armatimonadota bacterium]
MIRELLMPRLSDDSEQGWVDSWEKSIGDPISEGEVICTLSIDKAAYLMESPCDGVLEEILVADGEVVPVGTPIARVRLT